MKVKAEKEASGVCYKNKGNWPFLDAMPFHFSVAMYRLTDLVAEMPHSKVCHLPRHSLYPSFPVTEAKRHSERILNKPMPSERMRAGVVK